MGQILLDEWPPTDHVCVPFKAWHGEARSGLAGQGLAGKGVSES